MEDRFGVLKIVFRKMADVWNEMGEIGFSLV